MISTTRITDALTRAMNVRYALLDLYVDATTIGVANRIYKSAKDIFTLYALEKALYNATLYNFNDTDIETLISKIREYIGIIGYVSGIDFFAYKYPTVECPIIIGPYILPTNDDTTDSNYPGTAIIDDWITQNLTPLITVDGITVIGPLNFSIDDPTIDPDTIMLEVQGDNPKYTTNVSLDGWHMVDTILHWHHFYDLKIGMQANIRWRVK